MQLLHRGIEYSVLKVEPGIWKWTFRIGGEVTTGKTATNIDLLAARRVQLRINRALTEQERSVPVNRRRLIPALLNPLVSVSAE